VSGHHYQVHLIGGDEIGNRTGRIAKYRRPGHWQSRKVAYVGAIQS